METSEKYTKLVDRYLTGDLSGHELQSFEKELESNEDLRKELKLQQEINSALSEKNVIDLRLQLKMIHKEVELIEKPPALLYFFKNRAVQVAAASFVLFVVMVFFAKQFIQTSSNLNDDLYNKYYNRFEPVNLRSGSVEIDNTYMKALVAYQEENYEKAQLLFEEVVSMDYSKMEANLMSGASNMELNKYIKASTSFKKVIDHQDNLFIDDAEWYLGFCYLQTHNTKKAIEQFEKIAMGNSNNKEDAKKIARKINKGIN